MQHYAIREQVIIFLRKRDNMIADLGTICLGLPNLTRDTILEALKELVDSGDVLKLPRSNASILIDIPTWQALT